MSRSRFARRATLALALVAAFAATLEAQKSTMGSRGGRSSGSFGGSSAGRMGPVTAPRSSGSFGRSSSGRMSSAAAPRSPSGLATLGSSGGRPALNAPTLSPSFPGRGRVASAPATLGMWTAGQGSSGLKAVPPGVSTLSPQFPTTRGRAVTTLALAGSDQAGSGRVSLSSSGRRSLSGSGRGSLSSSGSSSGRGSLSGAGGKRFLPAGTLPVHGWDSSDWHKRSLHHHGNTVVVFDPFFVADPFFFNGGFFVGGSFFYGDPFFFGHRFVYGDPFFFNYRFGFGRPVFFGPGYWSLYWGWPGFWTSSYYNSGLDYANGYQNGFNQGYSSGVENGSSAGYGMDLQGYAEPDYGYAPPGAAFPASARFDEGRRQMAAGRFAAALSAFDAFAREAPDDGRGELASGMALLALGRYGDAAVAFRRGVDDYAPDEVVVFDAPALFGSRTAFREVQGRLEDYVRHRADDLDGRFDLGVLYLFSGELDAARSLLSGVGAEPYADRLLRQTLGS
jgi:hypothetical protein